jgi:hypothetical protein
MEAAISRGLERLRFTVQASIDEFAKTQSLD